MTRMLACTDIDPDVDELQQCECGKWRAVMRPCGWRRPCPLCDGERYAPDARGLSHVCQK